MNNNHLSQRIMAKIKAGQIKAKPKIYFMAQTLFYAILNVAVFLTAVFLASFVAFALRLTKVSFLLAVLSLAAFLIIILNIFLARKFPTFYKHPLLLGLLTLLILIAISSAAVLKTPFHTKMLEISQQNNLPLISPLYRCGCGCGCNSNNQTICPGSDLRNKNEE